MGKCFLRAALSIMLAFGASAAAADTGRLLVSADGRTFELGDGTPFVWLGDTAWELVHKLDRGETETYLSDRAAKGFTVIQTVVLAELDGLRTPNAYGNLPFEELDPKRPNEAYFLHLDYVVRRANELGMFVGLLPTWGDKVPSNDPGAGPLVFDPESARAYGLFLGERYRDAGIVWILGGDRAVDNADAFDIWQAMASGLEAGHGGRQLMTFHPRGGTTSSLWFHDDHWLDFNMFQSGHGSRFNPSYILIESDRALQPVKPVVDGEPAYESIPVRFWHYMDFSKWSRDRVPGGVLDDDGYIADDAHFADGFFSGDDVRVHLYWTLLSGAAGYTYGANAIWQMFDAGDDIAIPTRESWREALALPGSFDILHANRLFTACPPAAFAPDQSLVFGRNPHGRHHVRAMLGRDRRSAIAYLPSGGQVRLRLDNLADGSLRVRWYDPRTGAVHRGAIEQRERVMTLAAPDDRDWLLLVDTGEACELDATAVTPAASP